ncbi:gig2-like protein [Stylonychia lemnae]|uniref:Gig2-like protein n=1 Tax=Stylonychia lemnae TaxID=5949 RepID=A0A078AF40_STYLE|nr:gig2-like protein [Stylonychia lemnae]|eukprot:CDW80431.1 gig2-like protein [Stylonychia lemnae]
MESSRKHCKAQKTCPKNHSKHHCKLCDDDDDANHLARDCPKGITLFHGTKISKVNSILKNGLKPSAKGRIGSGIYFAEAQIAEQVSRHRGQGTGVAIFQCRVNIQYCTKSTHPPWQGVTSSSFEEWLLTDTNKYRIMGVALIDGAIEDNIYFPRGEIFVSGNCQLKGQVKAGRISSNKSLN